MKNILYQMTCHLIKIWKKKRTNLYQLFTVYLFVVNSNYQFSVSWQLVKNTHERDLPWHHMNLYTLPHTGIIWSRLIFDRPPNLIAYSSHQDFYLWPLFDFKSFVVSFQNLYLSNKINCQYKNYILKRNICT